MQIDFGRTQKDYAQHRLGFPTELFDALPSMGLAVQGRGTLDLGAGTGALARGLAARGARVTALDPSAELLVTCHELAKDAGLALARTRARAEHLPFADECFDLVCAGQCWWWFDEEAALAEIRRVLRPGGSLLIASYDWLPLPGSVVAATEALILKHNPAWKMDGGDGLHPEWIHALDRAGWRDARAFMRTIPAVYTRASWLGRIRASAGVGASLSPEAVARFDEEHAIILRRDFPEDPLAVPHRLFAVVAARD